MTLEVPLPQARLAWGRDSPSQGQTFSYSFVSIFNAASPIHDGALVLQQGRLTRAGCFLPLTQDPNVSKTLGTRHRAAIGLTELVDAVAIVVSEETGKVSVVVSGRITRDLDSVSLKRVLKRLLEPRVQSKKK